MEYIDKLEDLLKAYMTLNKGNLQIKGWYFGVNRNTSITVGVKNNKIGEIYSCPKVQDGIRGKLYIIWHDNRRTVTSLDSASPEKFSRLIQLWRRSSFEDKDAPMIYKDSNYPEVKLFDHATNQLVCQDKSLAFDILEKYIEELNENGIKNVDGSVSAITSKQYIKNSAGLDLYTLSTSFSTYVYGDQVYGKSFSHRQVINKDELNNLIQKTISRTQNLKKRTSITGGKMKVILMPEVAEYFIGYYLLGNLSGNKVANRRSCFSIEDFRSQKKVIREDISLIVDGTRDYQQGSYVSTFEGVPSGRLNLIYQGKLNSPILDLKYAKKLGYRPTPIPAGRGSVSLQSRRINKFETLIKSIKKGIIIYDILGMHTQDSTSGNYSLTAPNCILVEGGEMKGGCKAIIAGNFFDALRQDNTELAYIEFENNPAIVMDSLVIGEK